MTSYFADQRKKLQRFFRRRPPSILVVDDDVDFCTVIGEILMMLGFEVSVSLNVEEALGYLECEVPDLILTDITMPEKDGEALIRYLQSNPRWSEIPTVIVSARPRWEMASLVEKVGAHAFLDKPFSIRKLHATLAPLLPFSPIRIH